MSVHKLIFFCWLVATCFGLSYSMVTGSPNSELSTTPVMNSAETMETTTQNPPDVQTTPTYTASTFPGSSSMPIITTGAQTSADISGTNPTTSQDTQTTLPPGGPTTSPADESSSTPIITTGAQTSTAVSETNPTPPTQNPQVTQTTPTTSGPTTSPAYESSSTPIITTGAQTSTAVSETNPTPPTQHPQVTQTTPTPSGSTSSPAYESSSTPIITSGAQPSTAISETNPTPPTQNPQDTQTTPTSNETATSPSLESSTNITSNETAPPEPSAKPTAVPTITKPPACSSSPCPSDSACIESSDGFTCLCFPGTFFSGGSCMKAKVFAGSLHLTELKFEVGMEDPKSAIFQKTANDIIAALKSALDNDPTYIESKVLELKSGSVIATVDNIYNLSSKIDQESFEKTISECIDCGILKNAEFTGDDLCNRPPVPCDLGTTTCKTNDGIVRCTCKTGYIRSNFSDRSCSACLSGQKEVDNKECKPCNFGYSGFNCNDSSLLAVVVVSCVLGGLLLILVLAFIIYGSRTKKEYSSPYPPAQETRTTWSNDNIPKIPRASANISAQWDPSHLEMTESGSTRALVAKERPGNGMMGSYDDLRTFTGKNQSRYSYLVQGQDNPHFISDDGRGTK